MSLFTYDIDYEAKPFDLVVCNPPYLPLLKDYDNLALESTIAGTDLLCDVIMKSKLLGKKVYVQFSHLANIEAYNAAKITGVTLRPVGDERTIPFRLKVLWERPDYLNKLIDERALIENPQARHRYWHKIRTYSIE